MRNRPYSFEIHLINVKTMRTIGQIFVVFSEKLNFTIDNLWLQIPKALQIMAAVFIFQNQAFLPRKKGQT